MISFEFLRCLLLKWCGYVRLFSRIECWVRSLFKKTVLVFFFFLSKEDSISCTSVRTHNFSFFKLTSKQVKLVVPKNQQAIQCNKWSFWLLQTDVCTGQISCWTCSINAHLTNISMWHTHLFCNPLSPLPITVLHLFTCVIWHITTHFYSTRILWGIINMNMIELTVSFLNHNVSL